MPDLKFRCPECTQKIAVDIAAAGLRVDCPACMSTVIIPASAEAPVQVVSKGPYSAAAKAAAAAKITTTTHTTGPGPVGLPVRMPPKATPTVGTITTPMGPPVPAVTANTRELAPHPPIPRAVPAAVPAPAAVSAPLPAVVSTAASDALRRDLAAKQQELEMALAESQRLRTRNDEAMAEADQFRMDRERWKLTGEARDAEMKKLREDLTAATTERDSLRGRVLAPGFGQGAEEIERAKADLATLDREREEYKAKLSAIPPLREQLSALTAERAKLLVAVSEGKRDADALRAEIAGLSARLHHAEGREKEHARQMLEIGREQNEMRARLASSDTLSADLTHARTEAQQMRAQFSELARAFEAARQERDQFTGLAAQRQTELEQARQALETVKGEITKMHEAAAAGSAERERIRASADENAEEVRDLQHRVDSLLDDLHAREREVAELKPAVAKANERAGALEAELEQVRAKLTETEARLTDREKESVESAGSREKVTIIEAERSRLQDQLIRANADLGAAQEQLRNLRTEKEQARSTVNELQSQMERNFDHVHALEAERDTLRSDLEAVKTGLERAKQHVSVLQARRDVLREEINKLRARLGLPPEG